jgi:NADH dehydrogenase [ubiquinone] 1 alpha subcomplex assembly factor 2
MWAYVASGKRLPVQWSAWLTHTRPDPPSIEELQADLARQQRVKLNAAILEARDEAERANGDRLHAPSHDAEINTQSPSVPRNVSRSDQKLEPPESDQRPKAQTRDPWAEALKGSDEPRSWTPMARKR